MKLQQENLLKNISHIGETVISNKNALNYKYLDTNKLDKKKLSKGKNDEIK